MKIPFTKRRLETWSLITFTLAFVLVISPIWVGGISVLAQCFFAVLLSLGFILQLHFTHLRNERIRVDTLSTLWVGLALVSLCQVIPLPESLIAFLSPQAADLAVSARHALELSAGWIPLSLNTGETIMSGVRLLSIVLLYLMIVERIRQRDSEAFALYEAVALIGLVVLVLSFVQSFFQTGPLLGAYEMSSHWISRSFVSTFINENHQAAFFNLTGFVALGVARESLHFRRRVFFGTLGFALLFAAIASGSRGAWAATCFGGVLYFIFSQENPNFLRRKKVAFSVVLAAGIGIGTAALWTLPSSGPLGVGGDFQNLDRKMDGMVVALDVVADYPIFGVGANAFGDVASIYNQTNPNLQLTHPENIFLQLFVDYGIPLGLIVLFTLAGILPGLLWRGVRNYDALGPVIGILAVAFQNLVDFSLSIPGVLFLVVVLLGVLESQDRLNRKGGKSRGLPRQLGYGIAGLCILMTGLGSAYSSLAEDDRVDNVQSARFRTSAGDTDKAEDFTKTLPHEVRTHMKLRPADAHAFYMETQINHELGDGEAAKKWLAETLKRSPYNLNTLLLSARIHVEQNEFQEGEVIYRRVLNAFWGSRRRILGHLGRSYREAKSRKESPERLLAFLQNSLPSDTEEFIHTLFYLREGKLRKEAYELLRSRLEKTPSSFMLRRALASELVSSESEVAEVRRQVTQLMARHPDAGEGYLLQGYLYERERRFNEAWAMFKESERRDPTLYRAALSKNRMLVALGRVEGVRSDIGRIRSSLGKDRYLLGEMHRVLSLVAEEENTIDEAIIEMELATRKVPSRYGYWIRLANLCEKSGQLGRALDAYEAVQAYDPSNEKINREVERLKKSWSPEPIRRDEIR